VLQRIIAAVLGVLGLLTIGLGVASATAWRAADTVVATASATGGGTLVTTAPGVLEVGGGPVTAHARGGGKVVLAIGRESDVKGWVGTDAHRVVTGLADLRTLQTTAVKSTAPKAEAPAKPAAGPDPDGSDLWVQQSAGKGSADLTWIPQPGRWTLLVASAGQGASTPSVVLSWSQEVTTPWLVPGIVLGAILLLAGIALAARPWLQARRGAREPASWHSVRTGAMPVVASAAPASAGGHPPVPDDAPTLMLTRRQMREVAAGVAEPAPTRSRRRRVDPGDGPEPETGGVEQVSPTAAAKRNRRTGRAVRPGAGKAASRATKGDVPAPAADVGPSALPRAETASGEARADAWRRSWGFPEATDPPDQTGRGPRAPQPGKDD